MNKSFEDKSTFHGAWRIPGGGMEFGETPLQTVMRELKEEVGLEIAKFTFIPKIYTEILDNWQGLFIVYLCTFVLTLIHETL